MPDISGTNSNVLEQDLSSNPKNGRVHWMNTRGSGHITHAQCTQQSQRRKCKENLGMKIRASNEHHPQRFCIFKREGMLGAPFHLVHFLLHPTINEAVSPESGLVMRNQPAQRLSPPATANMTNPTHSEQCVLQMVIFMRLVFQAPFGLVRPLSPRRPPLFFLPPCTRFACLKLYIYRVIQYVLCWVRFPSVNIIYW